MKTIDFEVKGIIYSIPNAWELLSPDQYEHLIGLINKMAAGELSVAMVRVYYVCNVMGWNVKKIKDTAAHENIAMLAQQVTFIFNIEYPDASALQSMDEDIRKKLKKQPPTDFPTNAMARYLARQNYKYVLDGCFCSQLIPAVKIKDQVYAGYRIDSSFDTLTCSLRALQYIEARSLIDKPADKLPLLAAILYLPGEYDSERAHTLALEFTRLPQETLQAIAFNFQCFNNYLFTKTEFSLLTAGEAKKESAITTGALESLYNLSTDGMGDINVVKQMNLIEYLTIIRKKLIEAVKSMADAELKASDIEEKTGLPVNIINQIIK